MPKVESTLKSYLKFSNVYKSFEKHIYKPTTCLISTHWGGRKSVGNRKTLPGGIMFPPPLLRSDGSEAAAVEAVFSQACGHWHSDDFLFLG